MQAAGPWLSIAGLDALNNYGRLKIRFVMKFVCHISRMNCSFAISTVPKSAADQSAQWPSLHSSESAVLCGLTIVFFLAEGASRLFQIQSPPYSQALLVYLSSLLISRLLIPSLISCSIATPVGLGLVDLLPVGRLWLGAHCKFLEALSSPNRGKTKAQCYGVSF
ncbi:hypothetical protein TNCV_1811581 [Trichonephila clavipes]|nr:hypothetical protein TNCV_1811581 [Trichonephila clavipes]